MPHQNTQFRVPAAIEELGRDGVVRWDGASFDRLTMEYVVKTEPVERGMLVVTSPFSGVFPAGIPVGRVDTAYAAAGRNDYVIHLEPAAPISEVGYVYVLRRPARPRAGHPRGRRARLAGRSSASRPRSKPASTRRRTAE